MLLGEQSSSIGQVMVLQVGSEMLSRQFFPFSTGSATEPMPAPKASASATGLHNPLTDLSPHLVLHMHRSLYSATHGNTQNPT